MFRRERDARAAASARCARACCLVFGLCLLVARAAPGQGFDWRDVDGQDFTTPVRSQGSCGSCWAFAAVGAMESKLEITAGDPNWNPDASEQHLLCDGSGGSCKGGWEYEALRYLQTTGVVSEAELPYRAADTSPDWPLAPGWEDRVFRITGYTNWLPAATAQLKVALQIHGPLVSAMNTGEDWYWPFGTGAGPAPDGDTVGVMEPLGGINHAVAVVGYQDDAELPEGGYWIVKNSWGSGWGDGGYGYVLYGDLERHDRIHAISGDAYRVPEPAGLLLLLFGAAAAVLRRRAGR